MSGNAHPQFSIIIPARNASNDLARCLDALLGEPTIANHEIIVVDDASEDDTSEIARSRGISVHTLPQRGGPAAARNHGALHANNNILWFLDADTEVRSGALRTLENFYADHSEDTAVIGSYDNSPSAPQPVSQFKNLFHHYVHQNAPATVSTFWSGCGAISRDLFNRLGGFDSENWNRPAIEDIHLGYAITAQTGGVHVLKELQVRHHKRWTLYSLIKTDVFDRAIPWTAILLAGGGRGGNELNVGWSYKLSVASMGLACIALISALIYPALLGLAAVFLLLPLLLNRNLLRFFVLVHGPKFLFPTIPLLWLYFFYCGLGFFLGIFHYLWLRLTRRRILHPRELRETPND